MDEDAPEIGFDWDAHNISHLARHRINPSEVEEFFANDPAICGHEVVGEEERWTATGITSGLRALVLVFTVRGSRIRPITGWNADRLTRQAYFRERGV